MTKTDKIKCIDRAIKRIENAIKYRKRSFYFQTSGETLYGICELLSFYSQRGYYSSQLVFGMDKYKEWAKENLAEFQMNNGFWFPRNVKHLPCRLKVLQKMKEDLLNDLS
jgi:hypothetical protein